MFVVVGNICRKSLKQMGFLAKRLKMAGDIEPDELEWDKIVFGSWLYIMPCTICRYSSSVLAEYIYVSSLQAFSICFLH